MHKKLTNRTIRAVLFDLDGTLLDTAPDLVAAMNQLRANRQLAPLPAATLSPYISLGASAMVKAALNTDENNPHFKALKKEFLAIYNKNLAVYTQFFPEIDALLRHLEERHIPWGIVTNKLTQYTQGILAALQLGHRPACVICGDSLPTAKPNPEPLLHACTLIKQQPEHCIYLGDAATDVAASKAAGTLSLVALYGYIQQTEDPYAWQADGYIQSPLELIHWL